MGESMIGDKDSHVTVSYEFGGVEITRVYAISEDMLTEAQPRAGKDLQEWLADKGCALDSADGPAISIRVGSILIERYYRNGKLHREEGPACVGRDSAGSREEYYRNGKLHRQDGPAVIACNADGSTSQEAYFRNGVLDRQDGPVVIVRNADGSLENTYYCNGVSAGSFVKT
jgi:antitoxin component YwqK of YwqJK toxin-antitoxin module